MNLAPIFGKILKRDGKFSKHGGNFRELFENFTDHVGEFENGILPKQKKNCGLRPNGDQIYMLEPHIRV